MRARRSRGRYSQPYDGEVIVTLAPARKLTTSICQRSIARDRPQRQYVARWRRRA
jgi:hypothetical protein